MIRIVTAAVVALLFSGSSVLADTYGEKVKAVDTDKKSITIPIEGKDRVLKVADKVDVQTQVRRGRRLTLAPIKEGLKGIKPGVNATITTEKLDGEEVVTKIILLVPEKK